MLMMSSKEIYADFNFITQRYSATNLGHKNPTVETLVVDISSPNDFVEKTPSNGNNIHKRTKSTKLYTCEICKAVFLKQKTYLAHMKKHDERMNNPKCQLCRTEFSSFDEYCAHNVTYHGPQTKFVCNICKSRFLMEIILLAHQETCSKKGDKRYGRNDDDSIVEVGMCEQYVDELEIDHENELSSSSTSNLNYNKNGNKNSDVLGKNHLKRKIKTHPPIKKKMEGSKFLINNKKENDNQKEASNKLCLTRGDVFDSSCQYSQHLQTHTAHESINEPENMFACETCYNLFKTRKEYMDHLKSHENGNDVQDDDGSTNNPSNSSTNNSPNISKNISSNSRRCTLCLRTFSSTWNYLQHIKVHEKQVKFIESIKRKMSEETLLYASKSSNDTLVPNFESCTICPHCGKNFKSAWKCFHHIATHSESSINPSNNICPNCNKTFDHLWNFYQHLLVHAKYSQGNSTLHNIFSTNVSSNNNNSNNDSNNSSNDNNNNSCNNTRKVCKKPYNTNRNYLQHKKAHSMKFRCKLCGSQQESEYKCTQHVLSHLKINSFRCQVCNKTFNSKNHVVSHCLGHRRAQRYSCQQCNMKFTVIADKLEHEKINNCSNALYDENRSLWVAHEYDKDLVSSYIERLPRNKSAKNNSTESKFITTGLEDEDKEEDEEEENEEEEYVDSSDVGVLSNTAEKCGERLEKNGAVCKIGGHRLRTKSNKIDLGAESSDDEIIAETPCSSITSSPRNILKNNLSNKSMNKTSRSKNSPNEILESNPSSPPKKRQFISYYLRKSESINRELLKCPLCQFRSLLEQDMTNHIESHLHLRFYRCKVCSDRFDSSMSFNAHLKAKKCFTIDETSLQEDKMELFDGNVEVSHYVGRQLGDEECLTDLHTSLSNQMNNENVNGIISNENDDGENQKIKEIVDEGNIEESQCKDGDTRLTGIENIIPTNSDTPGKCNDFVISTNVWDSDAEDTNKNGSNVEMKQDIPGADQNDKCHNVAPHKGSVLESLIQKISKSQINREKEVKTSADQLPPATTTATNLTTATTTPASSLTSDEVADPTHGSVRRNDLNDVVTRLDHLDDESLIKRACTTPLSLKRFIDVEDVECRMVNGLPENRWKRLVLMASKKDSNEKKAFNSSENCKVNAIKRPLKKKYGSLKRKAVKNKDEMFECEICHKTYTTAYYLRIHAKWHKLTNPKSCSYCTKRFDDDSELHEHLMLHAKDYPHKCSTCDKMFKKKVYLKCHMRLHTGEKPYKCKFCDKGFRVCSSLADHLKVHTGKRPYQCSFCNKKFAQRANWITHEKRHMGCKEFFCENCKKGFIQNFELQTHRLRCVTKEFKYECRMCDMKFTKENPFKLHCSRHCCIICGELFHNMREKVLHQVRCRRNGKTNTTKKPSTKLKGRAAALYKEFEMISSDDDDDEDEEDDDNMT